MARAPTFRPAARQRGASIVEVMVGVLIGLIVVAVIYNVLIVSEGFRRSTLGVADAQVTGQLSQFVVGRELANAGNGVMSGIDDFATCNQWRLRPIPVVIEDNVDGPVADPVKSDRITLFYGDSPRIVHSVRASSDPPPLPNTYRVFSPNGFRNPLLPPEQEWVMAKQSTPNASDCALIRISQVTKPDLSAYPPAAEGGEVALQFSLEYGPAFPVDSTSRVVNLGRNVTRQTYRVDSTPPNAKMQLIATNDNPGIPPPASSAPVASNVVLLKAQYGIDTNNDGIVDCWASAVDDACGNNVDYSMANLTAANPVYVPPATFPTGTAAFIRTIKAVRVALVVRSEDVAKSDLMSDATLVGRSAWLFNCAANDATCQGRILINNTVLQDYGRYRIYEATVPLRNSIWNAS